MEIKGLPQLHKRLDAIQNTRPIMHTLALDTKRYALAETRAFRKTGNLGRSIDVVRVSDREAIVSARSSYALFVEKGTGIYGPKKRPIVPKNARMLAWRTGAVTLSGASRVKGGTQIAGWAFAKSVKGRPATPFMEPGAKKAAEKNGMKDVVITLWNGAA